MQAAAKDEAYGAANITADKGLQFQITQFDGETEATTRSLADTEHVTIQLESEIYAITLNEQNHLKKEFSIRLIEFEACSEAISIQALSGKQLNNE
jgi:hypothetical protein